MTSSRIRCRRIAWVWLIGGYPYADGRAYAPPDALPDNLERMVTALGIERFVLVQPSPYGDDNRRLLDALRTFGERARGVVVLPPDAPDVGLLREWHALGVRGVRLNLASGGARGQQELAWRFSSAADVARKLPWHIEITSTAPTSPCCHRWSSTVKFPSCSTTSAGFPPPPYTNRPILRSSSGCSMAAAPGSSFPYRLVDEGTGPADVVRVAHALLRANPDRLVWGSDWPHTGPHPRMAKPAHDTVPFRDLDRGAA